MTTSEYGIFNDEGMIDGPYHTKDSAAVALAEWLAQDEPNLEIVELCPDHEESPKYGCEACETDEDEATEEDEDDEG